MTKAEIIYLASKCFDKGWDYEKLMYGDDLYGKENLADDVWEYVCELKDIGRTAFYIKYSEYKLY